MEGKTTVGVITNEEKREIEKLIEHFYGLKELSMIVPDEPLRSQIETEKAETKSACYVWWSEKQTKYGWQHSNFEDWHIDIINNTVYY